MTSARLRRAEYPSRPAVALLVGATALVAGCTVASAPSASRPALTARPLEPGHADPGQPEAVTSDAVDSDTSALDPLDEIEDDPELADSPEAEGSRQSVRIEHPFTDWRQSELEAALRDDPERLGSMSVGSPSAGALVNAKQMPPDDRWALVDPAHAWGTEETLDYLARAIEKVHAEFPNSPKLHIGHISSKRGGHLEPHLSHQSGRDVDIGFFYSDASAGWYARAGAKNLDVNRTWALVRALITETDVEMILIDHSVQRLLRSHAAGIGEDPAWLASVFEGGSGLRPIIRHAPGHATHLHVRFYNPIAQETARLTYDLLVRHGFVKPTTQYVVHRVRKGETLTHLARKYGTTVKAIQHANNLRSTVIQARKTYRIPRAGGVPANRNRLVVPHRRLPPARSAAAAKGSAAP